MSRRRSWFFGIGCLGLLVLLFIGAFAIRAMLKPSLPGEIVLSVRLQGGVPEIAAEDPFAEIMGSSTMSLRQLRDALRTAEDDDRVVGVRVRIDAFGGGFATAQEIRGLLEGVRAAGKWSAAYMDTAGEFAPGNLEYFVASACDEVSLNPLGDVNLIGLSVRSPFVRGTLDKLGARPEFPGRGDYKTARFLYTERDFTPAHKEMMEWLLGSLMEQMVDGIGVSRGLESENVWNLVDRGPFLGAEAVDVKLVDHLEDWWSFLDRTDNGARSVSVAEYLKGVAGIESGPRIAVVTAVGGIVRGESHKSLNPMMGDEIMGAETIARAFRSVRNARGIKAVVFRVESPGGSAVASEIIRQEMVRTAEEIPVVVSMANIAGSGGYWVACGAQKIVANPATLTGSIGVLAGHLNLEPFWTNKLGVTFGRLDYGANSSIYGELDDWTDGQRAVVDRLLDRIYDNFVERVASSRNMSVEAVDAVGRGRVFTGAQAVENGLVDVVGGFDAALEEAQRLAGLDPGRPVRLVDFPRPVPWWQQALERGRGDEAMVQEAVKTFEQWWRTGEATVPGVVWMPPVFVR